MNLHMTNLLSQIRKNKFEAHLLAFSLMIIPPIPLYIAAQRGGTGWIWALLGAVILGNLLALLI